MEKKISTPVDILCKGAPQEFATYFSYCRGLKFDEKPDYDYCRKLFSDLMVRMNYKMDFVYDWTEKKRERENEFK